MQRKARASVESKRIVCTAVGKLGERYSEVVGVKESKTEQSRDKRLPRQAYEMVPEGSLPKVTCWL